MHTRKMAAIYVDHRAASIRQNTRRWKCEVNRIVTKNACGFWCG